jgi:RNA polymerase sigma-70 factor (ECF subfamily)
MQGLARAARWVRVTTDSELEWVRKAQAGDRAAVERLVRAHWQRVQRLLLRVLGPRDDLEDIVQIAFLETIRALPSFRHESSVSTFISGVAVRVARRAMRPTKVQQGTRMLEDAGTIASTLPGPEQHAEGAEALRRTRAILEQIAEPKRVAFLLWAIEGMAIDEIAGAMQASVPATRSRIFYAQKELKAEASKDPLLQRWLAGCVP